MRYTPVKNTYGLLPEIFEYNKFAPKLTFFERCCIFALRQEGVATMILAEAFGVSRRTIKRIISRESGFYMSVKEEYEKLGPKFFAQKYLQEPYITRVNDAAKVLTAQRIKNWKEFEERDPNSPNPNATAKQGFHPNVLRPSGNRMSVEIRYFKEGETGFSHFGWMLVHPEFGPLFAADVEEDGGKSTLTSSNCYNAWLNDDDWEKPLKRA